MISIVIPALDESPPRAAACACSAQGVVPGLLRVLAILLQHERGMRAAPGRRFFDPVR